MAKEFVDFLVRLACLFRSRIQTFLQSYFQVFKSIAVIIALELEITLILYALHFRYPVHRDLTLVEAEELSIFTEGNINWRPTFDSFAYSCGRIRLIVKSDGVYEISSK
jgi:hypothetical protein